jgi:hypothetical protein
MIDLTVPTEATPWQQKVLAFRSHCHIFNGGPRGNGKSVVLCFDALDHCRQWGALASGLICRESHAGLQEIMLRFFQMARIAFGSGTSINKSDGVVSMPNGAMMAFSNLGDSESYAKQLGKSRTFLGFDEFGNYLPSANQFVNMLRSNLRGPRGVICRIHITANPRGRNHTYCVKHFVNKSPPWTPYLENGDGDWWVNVTADSVRVNPHINADAYERQLRAATAHDENLQRAWLTGDWHVSGGGLMFGDVWDPAIHLQSAPRTRMRFKVGADHGTASPSTAILLGEVLDPVRHFRPGDICVLDYEDTCPDPNDLSLGDGSSPPQFAGQIKTMLTRNGCSIRTEVITDDARGLFSETVLGLYRAAGLNAHTPRKKDRVGGWNLIRKMLIGAALGERRGLYVAPHCTPIIETLVDAPRDDKRPEDILRTWPYDHHLDGLGYGLRELAGRPRSSQSPVIGAY